MSAYGNWRDDIDSYLAQRTSIQFRCFARSLQALSSSLSQSFFQEQAQRWSTPAKPRLHKPLFRPEFLALFSVDCSAHSCSFLCLLHRMRSHFFASSVGVVVDFVQPMAALSKALTIVARQTLLGCAKRSLRTRDEVLEQSDTEIVVDSCFKSLE